MRFIQITQNAHVCLTFITTPLIGTQCNIFNISSGISVIFKVAQCNVFKYYGLV